MTIDSIVGKADDALNARRVFGEPVNKNGLTVIPAARIMGGGGGGEGLAPKDAPEGAVTATPTGSGAGFGLSAQPAGVFVLKGEEVRWIAAVDVNRIIFGMQIVAIFLFLTVRSIAKMRYANPA
jgi:uncharacterized spore protein YtfJ